MWNPIKSVYRSVNPPKKYQVFLLKDGKKINYGKFQNDTSAYNAIDMLLSSPNNPEIVVRNLATGQEIVMDWRSKMKRELDEVI